MPTIALNILRPQPMDLSLKPFLVQVHQTFIIGSRQARSLARNTGFQMREKALTPVFLIFCSVASSVIPDDAYDWEGDMFEEDHYPSRVSPANR